VRGQDIDAGKPNYVLPVPGTSVPWWTVKRLDTSGEPLLAMSSKRLSAEEFSGRWGSPYRSEEAPPGEGGSEIEDRRLEYYGTWEPARGSPTSPEGDTWAMEVGVGDGDVYYAAVYMSPDMTSSFEDKDLAGIPVSHNYGDLQSVLGPPSVSWGGTTNQFYCQWSLLCGSEPSRTLVIVTARVSNWRVDREKVYLLYEVKG